MEKIIKIEVTDLKTSSALLKTKDFKPFVGRGLLGGGFLGDERIKQFWHGIEVHEAENEAIEIDETIAVIPMQDIFDWLDIKKVIEEKDKGVKMYFKLIEGNFKAVSPTTVVFPAFTKSDFEALGYGIVAQYVEFALSPSK